MSSAAPASTCSRIYCGKHPQERAVGVCSACLANKLSSLIYTSTALAISPEILDNLRVCSPLGNSPPGSINSPSNHHHPPRDHLQTINEEADSTAQEIDNDGLVCSSTLEAAVEVCAAEAELAGNKSVHSNITKEQISLPYDVVHPIEEENPIINQDISLISEIDSSINEEVRPINLEEGKPKANPYLRANKPIKCKRSKSLCGLKGESLIKLEHEYESAAKTKGEQNNTGAKKVTLQTLFQLDDEDKWRNRALMATRTSECELGISRFSADYKPIEDVFDSGSICNAKHTEEAKDVHHNHTHSSHRCVPSASTLTSSVCPSMPSKLKHSVLLNSLLCRKTGDEKKGTGSIRKPSQANETSRTVFVRSFNEGVLTQASDEGGLIRATYIASESREALRRCRSKLERSVTRSSVSSSQPASPECVSHVVDMKSERKFNLSARALAAEFPFRLRSSAETAEAMVMIPSKTENSSVCATQIEDCIRATQIEDCKEGQDLRLGTDNDSVAEATQLPKVESKPAILLISRPHEEHHLAHTIPSTAEEEEIGKATESGPLRKAQEDEEVEHAETPFDLLNSQPRAADTTVMIPVITRANLEEAHEHSFLADAARGEEATAKSQNGIPTYITVGCRSYSSGTTTAAATSHKLPEELKNGGVWEAYSNKSGKGVRKWASRTAPAQSGLLRFYLTPLGGSGRTPRRPPKRHFWSLVFI